VEVHKRDGTYRSDRHGDVALVGGRPMPDELAEPPDDLTEAGKEHWRQVVPQLVRAGLADRIDVPALHEMCSAYARIIEARTILDDLAEAMGPERAAWALLSKGSTGQWVEHPAVKTERESIALWMRLSSTFGMNPVARAQLGVAALTARQLAEELADTLQPVKLEVIDGDAEDDD
jgi:P27 family predicted phage terminase small subunit